MTTRNDDRNVQDAYLDTLDPVDRHKVEQEIQNRPIHDNRFKQSIQHLSTKLNQITEYQPISESDNKLSSLNLADLPIHFLNLTSGERLHVTEVTKCNRLLIKLNSGKITHNDILIGHYKYSSAAVLDKMLSATLILDHDVNNMLELSSSSISSKTNHNSPSLVLHQLVLFSISRSFNASAKIEEPLGTYTPDLTVVNMKFDDQSNRKGFTANKMLIDITSMETLNKLRKMPRTILSLSLNKYYIAGIIGADPHLISLSYFNDSKDTSWIYQKLQIQKKHVRPGPDFPSKTVIDHIIKRRPVANLTFNQFSELCRRRYINHIMQETSNQSNNKHQLDKPQLRQQIKKLFTAIVTKHKFTHTRMKERDCHLFMNHSVPELYHEELKTVELEIDENRMTAMRELNDVSPYIVKSGLLKHIKETNSHQESHVKLFTKTRFISIDIRAYERVLEYRYGKYIKDLRMGVKLIDIANQMRDLTGAYRMYCYETIRKRLNLEISKFHSEIPEGKAHKLLKEPKKLKPVEEFPSRNYDKSTVYLKYRERIDPTHIKIIQESGLSDTMQSTLINILEKSRNYSDLRFRHRVAIAIRNVRRGGTCFEVSHWFRADRLARVYISGMILQKDKGNCTVCYFDKDRLCRTELWRLPDIENYSINFHRLVAMLVSLAKNTEDKSRLATYELIVGRMLNENSWGLSKFYKVYKYLATGICMGSVYIDKTVDKLIKTLDDSILSKPSLFFLAAVLKKNYTDDNINLDRTPLLSLPFELMGYESTLVNVCPKNTYGKLKHLKDTLTELQDEIILFNRNLNNIMPLHTHFLEILTCSDNSQVSSMIDKHLQMMDRLSVVTKDRFVFSPISAYIISRSVDDLMTNNKLVSGNLPHSSKILTAKASFCPRKYEDTMAVVSISNLKKSLGTDNISLCALKLLTSQNPIDLYMRMFDKEQVGGNREISILSSDLRILQVVVEYFCRNISSFSNIDMLDKADKFKNIIKTVNTSPNRILSLKGTFDQTRWGPNFNTLSFAYMLALMCKFTTEAYIPMAICILSEYKIFETPVYVPELVLNADSKYSCLGILGRSHMGQGIFHQTSSIYHSFVISTINNIVEERIDNILSTKNLIDIEFRTHAFTTSDDLCTVWNLDRIVYKGRKKKNLEEGEESNKRVKVTENRDDEEHEENSNLILDTDVIADIKFECMRWLNNLQLIMRPFCIKTSEYKNILSESYLEFNSLYLGNGSIAAQYTKFLYSLIEPTTTGNLVEDINNSLDSYYQGRQDLLGDSDSLIISKMNIVKTLLQYKVDSAVCGLPSDNLIRLGPTRFMNVLGATEDDPRTLETRSHLKYKTRGLLESCKMEATNRPNVDVSMLNVLNAEVIDSIAKSRGIQNYRSILSYDKSDKITIISDYLKTYDATSISYTMFLHLLFKERTFLHEFVNHSIQKPYIGVMNHRKANAAEYMYVTLKQTKGYKNTNESLCVSSFDRVPFINRNSSHQDICLHLLRHKHTTTRPNIPNLLNTQSYVLRYDMIQEFMSDIRVRKAGCHTILTRKSNPTGQYKRLVVVPPAEMSVYKCTMNLNAITTTDHNMLDVKRGYVSSSSSLINVLRYDFVKNKFLQTEGIVGRQYELQGMSVASFNVEEVVDVMSQYDIANIIKMDYRMAKKYYDFCYLNFCLRGTDATKPKPTVVKPSTEEDMRIMLLDDEELFGPLSGVIEEMCDAMHETGIMDVLNEGEQREMRNTEDDEMYGMIDYADHTDISENVIFSVKVPAWMCIFLDRYVYKRMVNLSILELAECRRCCKTNIRLYEDMAKLLGYVFNRDVATKFNDFAARVVTTYSFYLPEVESMWFNLLIAYLNNSLAFEDVSMEMLAHNSRKFRVSRKPMGKVLRRDHLERTLFRKNVEDLIPIP
uniref:RNA-dependent RNA polymerase n=1 Tax=Beihai barnacle virus 6 TaxID=1922364 RepID=A0A1L3KPC7_9VIRU|nr:RNA-dependent RNA polymerase [Beihai barnacle virus 6]